MYPEYLGPDADEVITEGADAGKTVGELYEEIFRVDPVEYFRSRQAHFANQKEN